MHSMTILTMMVLPGTFTATFFSTVVFGLDVSRSAEFADWLRPFLCVIVVLCCPARSLRHGFSDKPGAYRNTHGATAKGDAPDGVMLR